MTKFEAISPLIAVSNSKKYSSGSKVRSRREQTEDGDAETSNRVAKCCADRRKVNLLTIWLSAQCLRLRSNLSPHLHHRLVCRAATGATSTAKGKRKRGRLSSSSFRTQSRGRTGTGVNLLVFETSASTDSAIWASADALSSGSAVQR